MNKNVHLIITGRVQGVFFRASASRMARGLKINGFARNLPDGSVELVGEGEEAALERFIEWCRKGPTGSRVDHTEVTWNDSSGEFNGFNTQ
jgi:acylphosphatase